MGAAAVPLAVASTVMGVSDELRYGRQQEAIARIKAKEAIARGSRNAHEAKRAGDIVMSNARAAIAAGGGSTVGAGSLELLSKIESEKQYNTLASMYEGQREADLTTYEAKLEKKASKRRALTTALRGASRTYAYHQQVKD